jgi:VIT1/CCC1 family predicted Fe2+/Mn2+ transporter
VALALFAAGAGSEALNGRTLSRSGLRQVITGGLDVAVVFGVGHLLGAALS